MQVDHAQVIQADHQVLLQSMQDQTQRFDWLARAAPQMADAVAGIAFKLNDLKLNADQRQIAAGDQMIQQGAQAPGFNGNVAAYIAATPAAQDIMARKYRYGLTGSFDPLPSANPMQMLANHVTGQPLDQAGPGAYQQVSIDQALDQITGASQFRQNALGPALAPPELQGAKADFKASPQYSNNIDNYMTQHPETGRFLIDGQEVVNPNYKMSPEQQAHLGAIGAFKQEIQGHFGSRPLDQADQFVQQQVWNSLNDPTGRNQLDILEGTHQNGMQLTPTSQLQIKALQNNPEFQAGAKNLGYTAEQLADSNNVVAAARQLQGMQKTAAGTATPELQSAAVKSGSTNAIQGAQPQQPAPPMQTGNAVQQATQAAQANAGLNSVQGQPSLIVGNDGKQIQRNAPAALPNVQYQVAPNYIPAAQIPAGQLAADGKSPAVSGMKMPDGTVKYFSQQDILNSYANVPQIMAQQTGITDPQKRAYAVNQLSYLDNLKINTNTFGAVGPTGKPLISDADMSEAGQAIVRSGVLGLSQTQMDNYSPANFRQIVGEYLGDRETIAHTVLTGNLNPDGSFPAANTGQKLYSPNFGATAIKPPPPPPAEPELYDFSGILKPPGKEFWQGAGPDTMVKALQVRADPGSTDEQKADAGRVLDIMHEQMAKTFQVDRNAIVNFGGVQGKLGDMLTGLGLTQDQMEHAFDIKHGRNISAAEAFSDPDAMANPATKAQYLGVMANDKGVSEVFDQEAKLLPAYQAMGINADPDVMAAHLQIIKNRADVEQATALERTAQAQNMTQEEKLNEAKTTQIIDRLNNFIGAGKNYDGTVSSLTNARVNIAKLLGEGRLTAAQANDMDGQLLASLNRINNARNPSLQPLNSGQATALGKAIAVPAIPLFGSPQLANSSGNPASASAPAVNPQVNSVVNRALGRP